MFRALLLLAAGIGVGAGGMTVAHHHEDGEKVKVLSATDIKEKLDGKDAKVTVVEVTIGPGQAGLPHRHPGPAVVYVMEGEYELGIDDQPTKLLKAGDTFYEPTGCLHRRRLSRRRPVSVRVHPTTCTPDYPCRPRRRFCTTARVPRAT